MSNNSSFNGNNNISVHGSTSGTVVDSNIALLTGGGFDIVDGAADSVVSNNTCFIGLFVDCTTPGDLNLGH